VGCDICLIFHSHINNVKQQEALIDEAEETLGQLVDILHMEVIPLCLSPKSRGCFSLLVFALVEAHLCNIHLRSQLLKTEGPEGDASASEPDRTSRSGHYRCTVGLEIQGCTVKAMTIGGPAMDSNLIDRGDGQQPTECLHRADYGIS